MSTFFDAVKGGKFVISAEVTPPCGANPEPVKKLDPILKGKVHGAVVEENRDGVHLSSLVAAAHLKLAGVEAVVTMLTRDTNRIGLQSLFLGAVSLGITDVLVLSGYHQALTAEKQARGVYDVDSVQAIDIFRAIRDDGLLVGGQKVEARVPVCIGGSANPFAGPIELRALRLAKKVKAGADFIITHPVFEIARFREWLDLLRDKGIPDKVCLIAGIMWLSSAEEAKELNETYRGMNIPQAVIQRLSQAGDPEREGLSIASEMVEQVKALEGVRGLHFWARGREESLSELLQASGASIS
jgi:methylenetetrahydrofolate reductase (NADPH)